MTLADGIQGVVANLLGYKTDEAVIRDATYIHAERYDWSLAKPLKGQSLDAFHRWLDCWLNIEIADSAQEDGNCVHLAMLPISAELR